MPTGHPQGIPPGDFRDFSHTSKPRRGRSLAVGLLALTLSMAGPTGCREGSERARALIEAKEYSAAIGFLRSEIDENPDDLELARLYGIALLRNAQPSLAVWPLRRVYEEMGNSDKVVGLFVEALVAGGGAIEGVAIATQALLEHPDNRELLRWRARARSASLDHEGALEDIRALSELAPEDGRLLSMQANILVKLDRLDEAEEALKRLKELTDQDESLPPFVKARFCASRAQFQQKKGDEEIARKTFQACLRRFPGEADIIEPMAGFLEGIGEGDEALNMVESQANSLHGKFRLRVLELQAAMLNDRGRPDEAEAVLRRAAESLAVPQAWLGLADHYIALDNLEAAADAIEFALTAKMGLQPGETEISYSALPQEGLFAYADILTQMGRFDRVRKIIRHLTEPAYKLLIEARLELAQGNPRRALEIYDQSFTLWPGNAGARHLAAEAAMQIGEFTVASEHYRDSLRSDSSATDAGLILGRIQALTEGPESVINTLGIYLMGNPNDLATLRLLVRLGIERRLPGLIQNVRILFETGGYPEIAAVEYALAVEVMSGPETALEFLGTIEELDQPAYFLALANWARMTHSGGDPEGARQRVRAALEEHPEAAKTHVAWAMTADLSSESHEEVVPALRRAIQLDPELTEAHVVLADWSLRNGDPDGAVAEFDRAQALEPREPNHNFSAAMALLDAGREEEAEKRLRSQLSQHPWHGDSGQQLAMLALKRGETGPETLIFARLGALLAQRFASQAPETLGLVRFSRGELPEAEAAFRRAIRVQPNASDASNAHYNLGRTLIAAGRKEEARASLLRALANEEFQFADDARATLEKLEGEEKG